MNAHVAISLLALLDHYQAWDDNPEVLDKFHNFLMVTTYTDTPEEAIARVKEIAAFGGVF